MRKYWMAVLAIVVVGAGAAVGLLTRHRASSGPTAATTSTSAAPVANAPLTGLPDPSGLSATRPALTVKIENTPDALPQWGVESADVVYEEIVNGGITRLAAVFNSHAPAKIGPVRSVRPTDTQIVFPLGGIFAYSGGAAYAVASISTAPVKLVDESAAGTAMFRDPTRVAPHNLYAIGPKLFAFGGSPVPPPALFNYRSVTSSPSTKGQLKVDSFVVPFPSIYPVTWTWNATTTSWDRTLFGQPDVTGTGVRESPKNVVVMFVNYVNGIGTMASYANLQGSGTADVFTNGHEIAGTWSRGSSKSDVVTYRDAKGQPILMTPGQTWVELLNVGAPLSVTTTK
ncbi:MAG: DUF3048 domain-containing protein [Acidobacteriota bacterium]|nr:DUF3048 domain-containing protein [Acidobacteriota bacterium]